LARQPTPPFRVRLDEISREQGNVIGTHLFSYPHILAKQFS
jgi:hypothetical protein